MRIRKSTSRLLGSAYSTPIAPPPKILASPPHQAVCLAPLGSYNVGGSSSTVAVSEEICELNRSPWDLIDDHPLSDPQVVDDLLDNYYIDVEYRACWLFSARMPGNSIAKKKPAMDMAGKDNTRLQVPKKTTMKKAKMPKKDAIKKKKENKEGKTKNKVKVKKEEREEVAAQGRMCKKNDGKGWQCKRPATHANSLCEHHFIKQKRSNLNPKFDSVMEEEKETIVASAAASKPSCSSKTRKKKPANDFNATEGFYYYSGFGLFHNKRRCWSTTHNSAPPPPAPKQEEDEESPKDASPLSQAKVDSDYGINNGASAQDDMPSYYDNNDIAGIDEGSSDEDYSQGSPGRSNINMNRKKNPWKNWRKTVKARSLKSLL
ncbi:hypothetical protein BAE44_0005888 [Dichanthelium oligosanthes]|uniref:WRC domain-containing protein n=1 Tax=Dichanthelium oligosanthes TaxID=888268 RepID=A0A1E5W6M6_9POAL|nr:hypothetical protein BAE44_0005888 [Dichanthelium oligosanthes]